MPLARAAYRAGQFFRALFPRLGEAGLARARAHLNAGELQLFLSMERRDQRHGLRVLEHLQRQGVTERDLLAAALLHDCGKGKVPVWLRVAYVLAPAYVEALAARAAAEGEATGLFRPAPRRSRRGEACPRPAGRDPRPPLPYGWSAALTHKLAPGEFGAGAAYRLVHHARLGAQLAEEVGSSPATVRYVSGVAAGDERAKIALLRAADEAS